MLLAKAINGGAIKGTIQLFSFIQAKWPGAVVVNSNGSSLMSRSRPPGIFCGASSQAFLIARCTFH